MKRYLCANHMYYLKTEGKSVQLSTEKCTICKHENRSLTLKDAARELESIAASLRIAHDDPYYDPFGITYVGPLEKIMNRFMKTMHPDYRKNFIEAITKGV